MKKQKKRALGSKMKENNSGLSWPKKKKASYGLEKERKDVRGESSRLDKA